MWSDSIQDALRVVKEISHGVKREIRRKKYCIVNMFVGTTILMHSKMSLR